MSPTRIEEPSKPIRLDLTGAFSLEHGLGRAELLQFGPRLEGARQRLLTTGADGCANDFLLPQRMLDDYKQERHRSLLGQILAAAKQLRDAVDRVVVLASPILINTATTLLAACCHPHHNELSRGQRGGRPRIFFAPAAADNDALQGLLDILPHGHLLHTVDDRWGLIAADHAGCNLIGGLLGVFWEALQTTSEAATEAQLAVVIGAPDCSVMQFAGQIGCRSITISNVRSDIFHPGVLLAASVMGMDIVKLLRGAAAMAERFVATPPGDNAVLDFAGLRHLLERRRSITNWIVETTEAALQPLARCAPSTNAAAPHLLVQLISEGVRRDRLRVTMRAENAAVADRKRIERQLPEMAGENAKTLREERAASGQPTAVVNLPLIDESSVGQLLQLFSIADAVEKELLNPER